MPPVVRRTITETFLERVRTSPDKVAYVYKPTYSDAGPIDRWKEVTFRQFHDECRQVSLGLMALGLEKGDRAAILSTTRFEWSLADMAILGAGAVTVPIYPSNLTDDVAYILNHSEARIAIVEDRQQMEKILEILARGASALPRLERIVAIDPAGAAAAPGRKEVMTLAGLRELGRREEGRFPGRFERNLSQASPSDLLTIGYTSGTTGVPKGAMITHDNMMSVLEDCAASVGKYTDPEEDVILSFLPFSHILGKVESMGIHVFGWKEYFAESLDRLTSNLAETRPTVVFTVPRIFEKAHARILSTLEAGSPAKRKVFAWALEAGRAYFSPIWEGARPGTRAKLDYAVADRLVFAKIRKRFGGRLKFAICGGAPLPREIGEFFQIAGITICEGYGLTETCAPVSLNVPDGLKFGAVGRPLPEVSIKIADDGEILVKSRKVFSGYYKMPAETAEVMTDGWFHTGDIGYIDSDGFLRITDRKKDIIVTSGGKNVAPQKIENLAKTRKFIAEFVVHGDRRNYLTALVTLNREEIIRYASESHILFSEYSELTRHPRVVALVQSSIDDINRQLASFETIKKFVIIEDDFSVETGELTPSLKVKRRFVSDKYRAELDSMYA